MNYAVLVTERDISSMANERRAICSRDKCAAGKTLFGDRCETHTSVLIVSDQK